MKKNEALLYLLDKLKEQNQPNQVDIAIPEFMAKRVIAYQSMRSDMIMVQDCIRILLEQEPKNPILKAALWYTSIAIYGRCFTDAERSGFPKLEANEVFVNSKEHFENTHSKIMELRHKFVAHRGETSTEVSMSFLRWYTDTDDTEVIVHQLRENRPKKGLLKKMLDMSKHLQKTIEEKYAKAADKAYHGLLQNFSPDELSQMVIR